jgi:hypothetical protein
VAGDGGYLLQGTSGFRKQKKINQRIYFEVLAAGRTPSKRPDQTFEYRSDGPGWRKPSASRTRLSGGSANAYYSRQFGVRLGNLG